uniref:RNase III domain-containing protein n=1 Tax=Eutreptiella gymnastica TaxID=73025 RepID=A0A7S4GJC8_9EUGL
MKRCSFLLLEWAGRKNHWGPIRGKKDMKRVQMKKEHSQRQNPSALPRQPRQPRRVSPWRADTSPNVQVEPAQDSFTDQAQAAAQSSPQMRRQDIQEILQQRHAEMSSGDFEASVLRALDRISPPDYPHSMKYFEEVPSDVAKPVPLPPCPKRTTIPAGYVPHLEAALLQRLGLRFRSLALLVQSFTHPSYVTMNKGDAIRSATLAPLSYVGHAIFQMHMRSYLMQVWPNRADAEYRILIDFWMSKPVVCSLAEHLNLPELALTDAMHAHEDSFLVSKSTAGQQVKKPSIQIGCELFEALVGAIYMDSDILRATDFIQQFAVPYLIRNVPRGVFEELKVFWAEHPLPKG